MLRSLNAPSAGLSLFVAECSRGRVILLREIACHASCSIQCLKTAGMTLHSVLKILVIQRASPFPVLKKNLGHTKMRKNHRVRTGSARDVQRTRGVVIHVVDVARRVV